jgi:hypothetical protein
MRSYTVDLGREADADELKIIKWADAIVITPLMQPRAAKAQPLRFCASSIAAERILRILNVSVV